MFQLPSFCVFHCPRGEKAYPTPLSKGYETKAHISGMMQISTIPNAEISKTFFFPKTFTLYKTSYMW